MAGSDAGAAGDASVGKLVAAARDARQHAVADFSGFKVGAALRCPDGSVFAGCNVENVAYPEGTCAEAGAIAALVAAGKRRVLECLVIGPGPAVVTPCGGCRQKLREFARDDTPIVAADMQAVRGRFTLGELLPHSFGPGHLA